MEKFPFPDKNVAFDEIRRDVMYGKLVKEGADINAIFNRAWNTGVEAAKRQYVRWNGETDFIEIAAENGLPIRWEEKDNVIAGMRYFSEYTTKGKVLVMYMGSIRKWALSNDLSMEDAENLILAHEFFHHLENTELGLTSKQYEVPMLRIFGFGIGKTGIRALSEVGAHAFARTYFELAGSVE